MNNDAECQQVIVRVLPETLRAAIGNLDARPAGVLYARPLTLWSGGSLVMVLDRFGVDSSADAGATLATLRRSLRQPSDRPAATAQAAPPLETLGRHLELLLLGDGTLWATCWLRSGLPAPLTTVKTIPGRYTITCSSPSKAASPIQLPRTSRALGSVRGLAAWEDMHVAIVGCGRTGSIIADAMCAQGLRRLTLVDDDVLDSGNLDGMALVSSRAVGRPKVHALGAALCHRFPEIAVSAIADQFPSERSLAAVASADAIVTAVDRDRPRLFAGTVSRQFLMMHLDVGSGPDDRGGFAADIRLTSPDGPCLLCLGGVADPSDSRTSIPGSSSRAVNAAASHLACQALMNAVASGRARSAWWRLHAGTREPTLTTEVLTPKDRDPRCPWCVRAETEYANTFDPGPAGKESISATMRPFRSFQ